jgi:hypothetical protein
MAPTRTAALLGSAREAHPLMGWRHPVTSQRAQLTHAVRPGRNTAECGGVITVLGGPWPEPGTGTPLDRCSICTQAVHGLWNGGIR